MAHKSNQWLGASVRTYKNYILVSYCSSKNSPHERVTVDLTMFLQPKMQIILSLT